jgi:hypothetical protein
LLGFGSAFFFGMILIKNQIIPVASGYEKPGAGQYLWHIYVFTNSYGRMPEEEGG